MPGDLLIAEGCAESAVTGISSIAAMLPREDVYEVDTVRVFGSERAALMERYEELRTANIQLQALYKEFEEDLAVAASLQQHLAPRPTVWGRVRVDTFSQAARAIGGDFGVVCSHDDRYLNLLLGDVSGHGISAALAANRIFSEMSMHLQTGTPLGEMLSKLNCLALQ